MNLPGFTVEASLAKSGGRYAFVPGLATGTFGRAIPQLRRLDEPKEPCIRGCICVSPIGCPCCDSLEPSPTGSLELTDSLLVTKLSPYYDR